MKVPSLASLIIKTKSSARRIGRAITRPDRVLAALATITFPLAVLTPFFTFQYSLGDPLLDAIYDYADPGAMEANTCSVIGGIALLFKTGDAAVAVVLLVFSVFFPAVKLALLWGVLLWPQPAKARLIRGLEQLGPWSMADVFVVSVMLLAFKTLPRGTSFVVDVGYYFFLVSVFCSLIATWLTGLRLERLASTQVGSAPTGCTNTAPQVLLATTPSQSAYESAPLPEAANA